MNFKTIKNSLLVILLFFLLGINSTLYAEDSLKRIKSIADTKQLVSEAPAKKEQEAGENWGAIAVDTASHNTDCAYGVGGGANKEQAEKYAEKFCVDAGGEKCNVVIIYQQCAAYALSKEHKGIGIGETKALAEHRAKTQCKDRDCYIVVSDCNE
ncbi:MAG: DUF4189 domain-containing protein [Legionella sp.]|uniref:DUF4189 domain-containing protein n=1 Tax=Legionella sp. TaxID=459 RepID=UPI0039E661BF